MAEEIGKLNPAKINEQRIYIVSEGKSADIEKRLRWDCFRAAGLASYACANIYPYASDEHIDTALRQIMGLTKIRR